ncbi:cytochrome P450 [Tanacetum coccineum]
MNLPTPVSPASYQHPSNSVIAELKSAKGATNTQNHTRREGFEDFSIKYLGGLFLLLNLKDNETTVNIFSNTTLASYFKSLVPWTNDFLIEDRVTWLAISGLPPKMWTPDTFTAIANHWGDVIVLEDCNPRQFNRTTGRVLIPVRILEFDGEIDSLFNGYIIYSSSREEDDDEVDEDATDEDNDNDSKDELEEDINSATNGAPAIRNFENRNKDGNTLCGNFGKYKPSDNFPNHKSNEGSTSNVVCGVNDKKENIPPSDKAICHVIQVSLQQRQPNNPISTSEYSSRPNIQRKKKFKSLRLIDPILSYLNRAIPSNSSSKSYNEAISDSFSVINRRNIRILSKPGVATSSESNEVDNTIDVGNEIGFTMTGKNKDIENILAKGDFNEVRNVDERKGTMFDPRGDSRFDNFISTSSLVDLPMGAKRFTKMNNLGNKLSKIDRVLVSQHVIDLWPDCKTLKTSSNSGDVRFKEENRARPLFNSNLFKQLSSDEVQFLDCNFTNVEIKEAVWEYGSDKAPGPDGFTFKFFKKHWDILENDVFSFVKEFESFFLHPLSVVGEAQMAFIKGRQIVDGPLIVNEIITWAKKHKKRLMLHKVDFEKAFDSLSWPFLYLNY